MEKTLSNLFDYQKFAENPRLQRIIDSAHRQQYRRELSLDEAELVNAAGSPDMRPKEEEKKDPNR